MNDFDETVADPIRSGAGHVYAVVLGVGVICALAIVSVHEATRPIIEQNRVRLRQRAILSVLPGATQSKAFLWNDVAGKFQPAAVDSDSTQLVFAGFDGDGKCVGLAIEAQGMGYQDVIGLLYGYSFTQQAVIGIRVLQSRETPGLGDRIEKDVNFLRNFAGLEVRLNPQGTALLNNVSFVQPGDKTEAWQIDGITGATISSRAVAEMLGDSTSQWIPRLYQRQADFSADRREDS